MVSEGLPDAPSVGSEPPHGPADPLRVGHLAEQAGGDLFTAAHARHDRHAPDLGRLVDLAVVQPLDEHLQWRRRAVAEVDLVEDPPEQQRELSRQEEPRRLPDRQLVGVGF